MPEREHLAVLQPRVRGLRELNAAKGNAVLVSMWFPGAHQILRNPYVVLEHALDSEVGFIVCVNQLERCFCWSYSS